jgi:uncharacterized protein YjbJ (UPF0337 family)
LGANAEQLKGRGKEAAGTLTGDKRLEREGKADRAAASAKQKVRDVARKVDYVIDAAREKAVGATEGSRESS